MKNAVPVASNILDMTTLTVCISLVMCSASTAMASELA